MSAIIKKLLLAVLTDKKALKTIGGILLGIVVLIMMPIGALTALLSGGITFDPDELKQEVAAQMSGENMAGGERLSKKLSEISEAMEAAGFADYVKPAQNISVVFLSDRMEEEGFAEMLAGCFQSGQTNESFLAVVNVGLSKSMMVLLYTFADGYTNVLFPTSPVLLISLSMIEVDYIKWIRKSLPLFAVNSIMVILFIGLGIIIGY